jgi:hypothetical protein
LTRGEGLFGTTNPYRPLRPFWLRSATGGILLRSISNEDGFPTQIVLLSGLGALISLVMLYYGVDLNAGIF